MRTIKCIGYEGYACGKIVKKNSPAQKRCPKCRKAARWNAQHSEESKAGQARWYRKNRERVSVRHHWDWIFNSKAKQHKNYKSMPFFEGWNPDKGGAFEAGASWVITNIGKQPKGGSLHIVDHAKGFVPGNLEWATRERQTNQQMFLIIARQKHEIRRLKERIQELNQHKHKRRKK